VKVQYEVINSKVEMKCVKYCVQKAEIKVDLNVHAVLEWGGSERVTPRVRCTRTIRFFFPAA
jgi:hypothetical protein